MFAVLVRFSIRSDALDAVHAAASALPALMRAEDGVVRFDALAGDDGTLVFDEVWRDRAAWERHVAARPAPIAEIARTIAAGFASPPEVDTYSVLEDRSEETRAS